MKIYTSEKYKEANRDRDLQALVQNVVPVCNYTMNNLIFLKNNSEMAKRTLVVRYEDMAASPFEYAQEILKHAQMDFHQDVKNWIVENTEANDNQSFGVSFTTSRDSKKTALMWREQLDINLAKVFPIFSVIRHCKAKLRSNKNSGDRWLVHRRNEANELPANFWG